MLQVCKIATKYGNKYFLTENKSRTVRAMLCFLTFPILESLLVSKKLP